MKKLYFARHGQTKLNLAGKISGRTETDLTDEGRVQAKLAGQKAKKLQIDLIVCSPMSRAVETAQIIAKEVGIDPKKVVQQKLVIERDFGELEGKPYAPDINLDGISDLEAIDDLIHRAKLALNWLQARPEDNILVVSHGSFGRALRSLIREEYHFNHPSRLMNADIHHWL